MRRTRPLVLATAIALIGASVFGGALAASAAPTAPVITAPLDGTLTATTTPTIDGTVSESDLEVTVTVTNADGTDQPYCATGNLFSSIGWSCSGTVALALGVNTFTATADTVPSTGASPVSAPVTITVYDNTVVTIDDQPATTSDATPTFTGTGPIGGTVDVTTTAQTLCSATVQDDWSWTCQSFPILVDGSYTATATATDLGGMQTADATAAFDVVPPTAPTIDPAVTPTTGAAPSLQGNVDAGSHVTVSVTNDNGTQIYCDTIPPEGSTLWTCDTEGGLALGTNTLQATATTENGDTSAVGPSITITRVVPPDVQSPSDGLVTDNNQPAFSGTSTAGLYTSFTIWDADDGESELCDGPVLSDGSWSCVATPALADGVYHYFVSFGPGQVSTDTRTITIDTTPPPPTMSYVFGPASVDIDAVGQPGADVTVQFYPVTEGTGEGGDGYNYGPPLFCPASEGGEGSDFQTESVGSEPCAFSGLDAGIWNIYSNQSLGSVSSDYQNDYFLVPTTPTLGAVVNADRSVTLSGTGTPGYRAIVQTDGGATVCSVAVGDAGTWACTIQTTPGAKTYAALQLSQGFVADTGNEGDVPDASFQGYSALTASVNVTVPVAPPGPPAPGPTPTPTATPTPVALLAWTLGIGGKTEYQPGDQTNLTGSGLPAGSAVDAEFHSTPVALGSTVVKADGTFSLHVTVPQDATAGSHKFVVTVTPASGTPSVVEQAVTVVLPPKAQADPPPKTGQPASTSGATGSERDNPGAPSSFTHSIDTFQAILSNPIVIAAAAAAGIALLLFVAFPAELLNATISEQYGRFSRRLPKVKVPWFTRFREWLERSPLPGGIAITVVASIIFGFADPGFGFDVTSVRVVLACAIALFIVGYLASALTGLIVNRRWRLDTAMELKPLGLILTVVGVVISRLLDFSPGFLIGLILGIGLVGRTSVAQRAKTTLVNSGIIFVFAILGWVVYSILDGSIDPETFGGALLFDTLVAVTTEGLTALFVGLLPFRFLEGESIFTFSKVIWAVTYIVAAIAFVAVVIPSAESWGEPGTSLWLWIVIVAAFAIVAVGIYLYFRFWAPPLEEEEEPEAQENPRERTTAK